MIDDTSASINQQIERFAAKLWHPDDFVELRCIHRDEADPYPASRGKAVSQECRGATVFVWLNELGELNERFYDVYVGINPRKFSGGTTDKDVLLARVIVADLEKVDVEAALDRVALTALPEPHLVVVSGHGVHLYWILDEPLTDLEAWTDFQKRLAHLLESDPVIHNPSRVLRLPGFTNHKPPAASCFLHSTHDGEPLGVADLPWMIPPLPKTTVPPPETQEAARRGLIAGGPGDRIARAGKYVAKVPGAVSGQKGHNTTFRVACKLVLGFGLSEDEAWPILVEYNARCEPPWTEKELRHKLQDAAKKPGPRGWLAEAGTSTPTNPLPNGSPKAGASPAKNVKLTKRLIERCLNDVVQREVRWLWPRYVPLGMITLFDGDPDQGKTFVTLDLVARVTQGWSMPLETSGTCGAPPANALLMSAEDAVDQTIKSRLEALGANHSRIFCLEYVCDDPARPDDVRPIMLPDDLPLLEERIVTHEARLVVIDPFSAFLSPKFDGNKDADVRRVLHQVKLVAERTGAAFVIVRHLNKMSSVANPMYRGGGSIAIIGAARSAFLFGRDPDDQTGQRRVFARIKGNLCPPPPSLAYHIEPCLGSAVVAWDGEVDQTAADLLAKSLAPAGGEKRGDAVRFLAMRLAAEPVTFNLLKDEASKAGISERTLRRAKKQLGIKAKKSPVSGQWMWSMMEEQP
jgi:hypothetical protein